MMAGPWDAKSLTPDPNQSSVEDLSHMVPGLAPDAMSVGGEIHGSLGGSAPGSEPVSAGSLTVVPLENLPKPDLPGNRYPVASPRPKGRGPNHGGTVS